MLVGNDIVDLHDPWSQPDKIHPRFDSRAFTPAERARIRASRSAHRLRWSLWAAKESAFKVARKLDGGVRFLPREFAVRMLGDGRAAVSHRVGGFGVWFERADAWLHAVAVPMTPGRPGPVREAPVGSAEVRGCVSEAAPLGVGARIGRVEQEGRDSAVRNDGPSARVREVARTAVGSLMNVAPTEIEILTDQGIPALQRRGERLPLDLSLSHHGRFVACAWAVNDAEESVTVLINWQVPEVP